MFVKTSFKRYCARNSLIRLGNSHHKVLRTRCAPGIQLPAKEVVEEGVSVVFSKYLPKSPIKNDGETAHYAPLASILNACVETSNKIVNDHQIIPKTAMQWFDSLIFIPWARPTADGVDGAPPLHPDLAGIRGSPTADPPVLYWGHIEVHTGGRRLLIPIEVKGSDAEMVKQAVTYARALNSATIFWAFELVLGYNYVSDRFRFFIFHRGGVSSSEGISLYKKSTSDLADLLRFHHDLD